MLTGFHPIRLRHPWLSEWDSTAPNDRNAHYSRRFKVPSGLEPSQVILLAIAPASLKTDLRIRESSINGHKLLLELVNSNSQNVEQLAREFLGSKNLWLGQVQQFLEPNNVLSLAVDLEKNVPVENTPVSDSSVLPSSPPRADLLFDACLLIAE